MSLTWGHRELPERRASMRSRVILFICAVAVALVAGIADPFVRPPPSLIGGDAPRTIQGLFDLHRAAVERGDRVSYVVGSRAIPVHPRTPDRRAS